MSQPENFSNLWPARWWRVRKREGEPDVPALGSVLRPEFLVGLEVQVALSAETATEILPDSPEVLASPPEAKRRFGGPQFPREGKIRLVNRANLDQRTFAARKFDAQVDQIKSDLGDDLSAIELALVESFCGATVMLDDMNVQVLTGKKVDVADYCQLTSTLTRVASRLGLRRKPRDVTPSLGSYLADRDPGDSEGT